MKTNKHGSGDLNKRANRQRGMTTMEYAVMVVLIAIAVAVAAPGISSGVVGVFGRASSVMK